MHPGNVRGLHFVLEGLGTFDLTLPRAAALG